MVESYIVSKLNTIAALSGQIHPTAAPVGDCVPPFSIYTHMNSVSTKDLSQEVGSYLDTIRIDLYHDDYDALCVMAAEVEMTLSAECEEWEDMYIFYCTASGGVPDGFDMNLELHRRTLIASVQYWR